MQPDDLQKLSRGELIELARARGVFSADALTRAELIDEILQRPVEEPVSPGLFGLLGVAGELVAGVVDSRLHMPEAANLIREMTKPRRSSRPPPPLPTVTLAEIYAAQGHLDKAIAVLDEVLTTAPDHGDARALRERLADELAAALAAEAAGDPEQAAPTEDKAPPAPTEELEALAGDADIAPSEPADAIDAPVEPDADEGAAVAPPTVPEVEPAPASADEPGTGEPLPSPTPPAHYGADEVVALATDPATAYVYWELRPERFARTRHADPDGRLVLRALTMVSRGLDVVSDSRDIPVDALVGDRFISGLTPSAELRLCLGWNGPKGFVPLAVATALQMPRDHTAPTLAVDRPDAEDPATQRDEPQPPGPVATATHRLRSYQAQLGQRISAPAVADDGLSAAIQRAGGPLVVKLSQARLSGGDHPLGGASELYVGDLANQLGAGDRYGGASDLHGGASDLHGGASDLTKPATRQ